METLHVDYMILGAGIIGMAIAKELRTRYPDKHIMIIEKEKEVACHSSGRNSGVLHAGFYYTENSLKAKFTRDGNKQMTTYCQANGLQINRCQKVVVAQNETELHSLEELYKRGITNGVNVELISEKVLQEKFPNVKTYKKALFSPSTSTVDPVEIMMFLKRELIQMGVVFKFNEKFLKKSSNNSIVTSKHLLISSNKIINCTGLYADKIAKEFGFSKHYTILPFKGMYLKYTLKDTPVKTNIYPVPNLKNPFLGVHYTVTVDGSIKIGPTAIPAFWRENYRGFENFSLSEFFEIIRFELKLFLFNRFNFRTLAFEEMQKYSKNYFVALAQKMVYTINTKGFLQWSKPGLRAQLLNTDTLELVQDFIVEGDKQSIHVLNAVSPTFTSSFPFAKWVVDNYIEKDSHENN